MLEDLMIAVPGGADTVEKLIAELTRLGLVGWAIDGSRLGHDDWVLARVASDDEGAFVASVDGDLQLLEVGTLRGELVQRWPGAQVGEIDLGDPGAARGEVHEVAVTPAVNLMLPLVANRIEGAIAEADVDDCLIIARVEPDADGGEALAAALANAKGASTVLWHEVGMTGLLVLRRGKVVAAHTWQPDWLPVGDRAQDDLRQALKWGEGDAAEIVDVLELSPDAAAALQDLMQGDVPSPHELCDVLGVPEEARCVFAGEGSVGEIPGAVIHEPQGFTAAMRDVAKPSDYDPSWVRWVDAGERELKWWFVLTRLAFLIICVSAVWTWLHGGSVVMGLLGLVAGVVVIVDLGRKWMSKRRN